MRKTKDRKRIDRRTVPQALRRCRLCLRREVELRKSREGYLYCEGCISLFNIEMA